MHFDGQCASTFTALTTSAWNVEREMPGSDFPPFGFGRGGKRLPDRGECIGVGGRVRARDAPDVSLVDGDDFVDMFPTGNGVMFARDFGGTVKTLVSGHVQDVEDQ